MINKIKGRYCLEISAGLFIVILLLVPIFFWPPFSQAFDLPKALLFRTFLFLALIFLGIHLIYNRDSGVDLRRFLAFPAILIFLLFIFFSISAFFASGSIQSIRGTQDRMQGVIQWLYYILFFCGLLIVLDKKLIKSFLSIIVSIAGVIALYAIFQKLKFDPLFANFDNDFFVGRVFSTLGNPDFLGQYLALCLPVSIGFIFESKEKIKKLFFGAVSVLFLFALFFSQSRAPFFGLLVSSLLLIIYVFRIKFRMNLRSLFKPILVGLIIFSITVSVLVLRTDLLNRFKPMPENTRSIISRLIIWESAIKIIEDNPFLGIGPENFKSRFVEYADSKFYEIELDMNTIADRTHNDFLEFGVAAGIPGIIIWGLLIFWFVWKYFSIKNVDFLSHAIFLSVFVYFFQNFFSFSETSHFLIFFFLVASIICLTQNTAKKYSGKILTCLFVLFILAVPFLAYSTIYKIAKAENLYTQALYAEADGQDELSVNLFNQAIATNPNFTAYRYALLMRYPGTILDQIKKIEKIEGETIDTLAWQGVALSKISLEKAIPVFQKALGLNPSYHASNRVLADAYLRTEKYSEAVEYYERFLEVSPKFWKWCSSIEEKNDWERWQYRIFHKNTPDFVNSIWHLAQAYKGVGNIEKFKFYKEAGDCVAQQLVP